MRPDLFIDRVLLPEVAVRLIMEDKSLSGSSGARKALQILRDSSSYGVAMFPEDAGEQGDGEGKRKNKSRGKGKGVYQSDEADEDETNKEMNVADQMAMEKARKRRLELEKEDEREQEMIQQEQERAKRELRKGKKKRKEESETEPAVRPKPKPKPKRKRFREWVAPSPLRTTNLDLTSNQDLNMRLRMIKGPLTPISNANAVPIAEDDDLDDLDAALDNAFIEEDDIGLPPRSTSSPSSRREPEERVCTESDSERATDKAASARSPSIEMLPPPPPESSEPANPKLRRNNIQPVASLASSSSSSYDRNEGMPGSSLGDWNDNCGLPPLEYMKQRRKFEGAQKKTNTTTKKGSSKLFQRSDSMYSDSGWIMDDSDDD
ncbi:hypothetical protein BT96DRAFT_920289 [Gymnopus androsaceus JB14]|uniref:Restriction of telomere capping protein 4 C-terminal domain-containing protein n=1 Tax=Gymnopus androsaceus JB14 TaxID=1447944 RepID=A0A6A4HNJ6_9AGAR|nr:hypothetical protein BT96DRAFT_920289 [Gymnopus androsaceus JB14]